MLKDLTSAVKAGFDFYHLEDRLSDKERNLRDQVREFNQTVVIPNINPYWDKAEFPREIAMQVGQLPIMGGMLSGYGCAEISPLEMGLVAFEMAKGDGSISTFYGVHSGLAMGSIGTMGSEEQKARWLPAMVRMEKIGAFGLTEPERGSNAVDVQTRAHRDGDHYVLNGAKRWIGNASISDVLIIYARDEDGKFGGYVIENPSEVEGVEIVDIQGKIGKRAILNADITLTNVRVPAENKLAYCNSFRDTAMVLGMGRYGVAWEAAGVATAAFEYALDYAKNREAFGKPIAGFQLIQQKLVEMATEVTLMQLLCFQMAELLVNGQFNEGIASMAKYNNARKARYVTQLARETMGGNGILVENNVARLMTDAEVIYTYEGTNEINMLLVGRAITGINAIV
ncbi:MAG: acyl-CoA dehydrogenase family protein [Chitinophagaceae bacterium]|nr:acyl-CoA dehydrogenase family protein [Anaerolineae bacterium]